MESEQVAINAEAVFGTLSATLSLDAPSRQAAEAQLRGWEKDAAPGFIGALVKIVVAHDAVAEVRHHPAPLAGEVSCLAAAASHFWSLQELRLLAAVVAKNAVGSSWRKVIATREWSRVPGMAKWQCSLCLNCGAASL